MTRKTIVSLLAIALAAVLALWGYYMFSNLFGPKKITYKFDDTLYINPLMGYAPDGRSDELCVSTSLVYASVTWAELEPAKGKFDWDSFVKEYSLDKWRRDGKRLVFRFICDYPSAEKHMDIPKWLYDMTGDGEYYDIEYGSGYCPDYDNETFIAEHERVIGEIGRFFSEEMPDFLAYVELGSLGHWGEWHTYYPVGIPRIPLTDVREKYVSAYEKAFPYAKLLMRRPFAERPELAGVYNDMTGDSNDTSVWLMWIAQGGSYDATGEERGIVAAPKIWEKAPVGGEFTSGTPMSVMLDSSLSKTGDLVRGSHMTFIGPMVPNTVEKPELKSGSEEVLKNVGYRYWVSSFGYDKKAVKGADNIELTIENSGVAPVYFDWNICIYVNLPGLFVEDQSGQKGEIVRIDGLEYLRYELRADLTSIGEGGATTISSYIPASVFTTKGAKIYVGIEDPSTMEPAVYLNMQSERNGKMSLLWSKCYYSQ